MNETNPYSSPQDQAAGPDNERRRRVVAIALVAAFGLVVGSYISAELLHIHHPTQPRTNSQVLSGTIGGILGSPIAMSIGVLPTLRFFESHGWLVIPGMFLSPLAAAWYYKHAGRLALFLVFAGLVLWSHNNYLAFQALMSV